MNIRHLDHLVITARDPEATIKFYTEILGMRLVVFGEGRKALAFGEQKINLHDAAKPYVPHAKAPTPGSVDLCFIAAEPVERVMAELKAKGVKIEEGIVPRTGALAKLRSLYIRDPDGNLIEISNEVG
jgi:catechol 2,3-dioxygenase-like lactoylglutathione lyase family enzyme